MFHSWTPNFLVVFSGAVPVACLWLSLWIWAWSLLVSVSVASGSVSFWWGPTHEKERAPTPKPAVICDHFMTGIPSVRCSGTLAPCIRSIASRRASGLCASWLIRWFAIAGPLGRQYWGSRSCTSSANHRCQARRLVQNILTHLGVNGVRDGRLSTSRRVPFLGFVLGLRIVVQDVAASFFYALSRQPFFSSLSLRRLWLRVAAQASRTSHSRCFYSSDVEASSFTSCCGRRVFFSERRCGVTVCLQSRRRQRVFPFRPWYRRTVHYDRGIVSG